MMENDIYVPEQLISKENVRGVTQFARKLIDFYDLISQTFATIKMILDGLTVILDWTT